MQVRILGAHNTESANSRLSGILINNELVLDAGSLTSSLNFEEQLGLKAILLTHHHYDHIRDIPALGMNLYLNQRSVPVYALPETLEVLSASFINGDVYPCFTRRPEENPAFKFNAVNPGQSFELSKWSVLPLSMPHSVPSIGYCVAEPGKGSLLYTGDTGPGFANNISGTSLDMIIVEVTASNRYTAFGHSSKHLTPELLEAELGSYLKINGSLPRVVCVHMYAALEEEIRQEIDRVASRLGAEIIPAFEGMEISV